MWNCRNCDESVEGDLACCWNCGTDSDGTLDPEFEHADHYQLESEVAQPPQRKFPLALIFTITTAVAILGAIGRISAMMLVAVVAGMIGLVFFSYVLGSAS